MDLGGGRSPRNPFQCQFVFSLDIQDVAREQSLKNVIYITHDVTFGIPFPDEYFFSISAFDFLEHIPRTHPAREHQLSFVYLMEEIERVLVPGGFFYALTPYFPRAEAFSDPTHINYITKGTAKYFARPEPWSRLIGYSKMKGFDVIVNYPKLNKSNFLFFKRRSHLLWVFQKPE